MRTEINTILFNIVHLGEEYSIRTRKNEYYSLMILISDYLAIPGFGLCCGMGSCGTCIIEINRKQTDVKTNLLSCSIPINDGIANTQIIIPEEHFRNKKHTL